MLGGCPNNGSGSFDGTEEQDAGPGPEGIDPATIGLPCIYDASTGENPSNQCAAGLSCMIVTYDGAYHNNMSKSVWEDQFTLYRDDGLDEGFCTLIGTWSAPPICPVGTYLKLFESNVAICLKACAGPADCGRIGYTCDSRFMDVPGPVCVRQCGLDIPDCVRSGVFQRNDLQNQPLVTHLLIDDVSGASTCDLGTGLCVDNAGVGQQGPGDTCLTTADCVAGTSCWQGPMLGLPYGEPGFCGGICPPDPQQPLNGCPNGFACQAGLQYGQTPFWLINSSLSEVSQAGGFCFRECQGAGSTACNVSPGTDCGVPNTAVLGQPHNGISMCLLPSLRQGG
jgi:hypothetical protein